jgi:hypothetical protein
MPIASVVVTLDERGGLRLQALARLVADRRIDLGAAVGAHVPAVIDTETSGEGVELVEALLATPGILGVDVVGIDFATDEDGPDESP